MIREFPIFEDDVLLRRPVPCLKQDDNQLPSSDANLRQSLLNYAKIRESLLNYAKIRDINKNVNFC